MNLSINPDTKVGDLLDAYPEAERVLVDLAPRFKALSNPVLRRTVARVTTLEQAARVGGIQVSTMVLALRSALGVGGEAVVDGDIASIEGLPAWVEEAEPVAKIDAGALLDAGETPVGETTRRLAEMIAGQVLTIEASFNPAPLVDAVRAKGHEVHVSSSSSDRWTVWVRRT